MNDIVGFGSIQPVRTAGAMRSSAIESVSQQPATDMRDQVSIGEHTHLTSFSSTQACEISKAPATPTPAIRETVNATSAPASSQVNDFEGFLLAGPSTGSSSSVEPARVQVSDLGTIAVIEDIDEPVANIPGGAMTINGISNISEGIFSTSGIKLA